MARLFSLTHTSATSDIRPLRLAAAFADRGVSVTHVGIGGARLGVCYARPNLAVLNVPAYAVRRSETNGGNDGFDGIANVARDLLDAWRRAAHANVAVLVAHPTLARTLEGLSGRRPPLLLDLHEHPAVYTAQDPAAEATIREADAVYCSAPLHLEAVRRLRGERSGDGVAPNYVAFQDSSDAAAVVAGTNVEADLTVGYWGSLTLNRGLQQAAEAAAMSGFTLGMITDSRGAAFRTFMAWANEAGVAGHIAARPLLPYRHLVGDIRRYDIAYIGLARDDENHRTAVPNKFFEALAAGLPVLTLPGTYLADIVTAHRLGVVVADATPAAIAAGVAEARAGAAAFRDAVARFSARIAAPGDDGLDAFRAPHLSGILDAAPLKGRVDRVLERIRRARGPEETGDGRARAMLESLADQPFVDAGEDVPGFDGAAILPIGGAAARVAAMIDQALRAGGFDGVSDSFARAGPSPDARLSWLWAATSDGAFLRAPSEVSPEAPGAVVRAALLDHPRGHLNHAAELFHLGVAASIGLGEHAGPAIFGYRRLLREALSGGRSELADIAMALAVRVAPRLGVAGFGPALEGLLRADRRISSHLRRRTLGGMENAAISAAFMRAAHAIAAGAVDVEWLFADIETCLDLDAPPEIADHIAKALPALDDAGETVHAWRHALNFALDIDGVDGGFPWAPQRLTARRAHDGAVRLSLHVDDPLMANLIRRKLPSAAEPAGAWRLTVRADWRDVQLMSGGRRLHVRAAVRLRDVVAEPCAPQTNHAPLRRGVERLDEIRRLLEGYARLVRRRGLVSGLAPMLAIRQAAAAASVRRLGPRASAVEIADFENFAATLTEATMARLRADLGEAAAETVIGAARRAAET